MDDDFLMKNDGDELVTKKMLQRVLRDMRQNNYSDALTESDTFFSSTAEQPLASIMEGEIVAFEKDFETTGNLKLSVPLITGDNEDATVDARLSPFLLAWYKAWKKPAKYASTIHESPIQGKMSIQGNDLTTTNMPILVNGSTMPTPVTLPPASGLMPPIPFTTTANISSGIYSFSGTYPTTTGEATLFTDENKFMQTPKSGELFPMNAFEEGWRVDEMFLQVGDTVVVVPLNGCPENLFVIDISEFKKTDNKGDA